MKIVANMSYGFTGNFTGTEKSLLNTDASLNLRQATIGVWHQP